MITWLIIAGILLLIIALAAFLYWDLSQFKKGISIRHGNELQYRLPALLPAAICFTVATKHWYAMAPVYIMMLATWWEFFDGLFNTLRTPRQRWRFNGSFNDPGHPDAFTDKILQHLSPGQQALLKWFLIAASLTGYILTF